VSARCNSREDIKRSPLTDEQRAAGVTQGDPVKDESGVVQKKHFPQIVEINGLATSAV